MKMPLTSFPLTSHRKRRQFILSDLQANQDEFTELIKEQEHCEDPDHLHQIWIRMAELNRQYFGTPATPTKVAVEVPAK